jgi:FkbM family methyltransferase
MKSIPFEMITESKMEKYRRATFWEKEPETIAWIDSFANDAVFFDVGANIGIYSLYCAATHPNCRVMAFEPHESNFNRLLDNVMLNNFGDRIKCHRYMIGETTGKKEFVGYSEEVGSSGGQMAEPSGPCFNLCRSIDDLVFFSFDFPSPNHIKIDIDGQELKVIRGMEKVLKDKTLRSVLVEIDLVEDNKKDILTIFYDNGFTTDNKFNIMQNHSRIRRMEEGINVVNIVFTRNP